MSNDRAVYYASVSGGKDSLAMCLHLQDLGIPYRAVFFDTGWEHPDTYRYVREVLPGVIGPIEWLSNEPTLDDAQEADAQEVEAVLGFRSAFVRWCVRKAMFPSRKRRFCTQELKARCVQRVMRRAHEAGETPVNCVGVRAGESAARANLAEREVSPSLDCLVWRPILRWSERDVIDRITRAGVAPNPLYLRGASRVGCWPCIMARKSEIRHIADTDDQRIRAIEALERAVGDRAEARSEVKGATLDNRPGLFQSPRERDGGYPAVPIREIVRWSRTAHGSDLPDRQLGLPGLNDGCLRWGLCESLPDAEEP